MARDIKRLLIANRSEIACRIARSARELGIETIGIHSRADRDALHVAMVDRSVELEGDSLAETYLDIDAVIAAARANSVDAIHPGYGFLAENARFAQAAADAGIVFVGPSPAAIAAMGDKIEARALAAGQGLPLVPSSEIGSDADSVATAAQVLGFPVVVKAAAGGGGRGMRVVGDAAALGEALAQAGREARSAFGDGRVYLEKYLTSPRHIEVQIFATAGGEVVHLGERECSVQRRHQKIIEEAPSPVLSVAMRAAMTAAAVQLARAIDYRGAGTVEFIVDGADFYFLEMNTRLQVEHAVTEMVTGIDLVRWQLETAAGIEVAVPEAMHPNGHAIECRIYAEDPANGFLPTGGRVLRVDHPAGPGIRVDSALRDGLDVPVDYDPMLAKIVAWAPDRRQATARMAAALRELAIVGVVTNAAFLLDVLASERFAEADIMTTTIEREYAHWRPARPERLDGALAAAALVAERCGAAPADADPIRRRPGPWETLGEWRAGTGRRRGSA
jgi:acetyl-CoA/propionyl-CoA carboxylase biotin carboxyl carrier protein